MGLTPQLKKKLFYQMLRIRRVQERIEHLYLEDQMKTPVHLCIGQEAVAAGVCAALNKEDYISSNHRGHGHYLAKGGDLNALIAELHGKAYGCAKGYGGSMHLFASQVGHLGSSSIVGGGIPIGTGLGLAIQLQRQKRVSVVFFGDGAADEGVFYESINFAMLKKLPVVYILENNQWSVCSPVSARQAGSNIFHNGSTEHLFSAKRDGNDAVAVYEVSFEAVQRARRGEGPSFIEFETYRILGHAGCAAQDPKGYRPEQEIIDWRKHCPLTKMLDRLQTEKLISTEALAQLEDQIQAEIEGAFKFAQEAPLPDQTTMNHYLFSGN